MYKTYYLIHVSCVVLSLAGFIWRGSLLLQGRGLSRWLKVTPHIIDTMLLASAIALAIELRLSPFENGWLAAKIIVLLAYVGFGMGMIRFSHSHNTRFINFSLALICATYIVLAALTKSVLPGII